MVTTRPSLDDHPWCRVCGTTHGADDTCPGSLLATGVERHGWRVMFHGRHGREVYGVLVAPVGDRWRSRIITYPRTLWTVPGGRVSIKFLGDSPGEAERLAVEFVEAHCSKLGYRRVDAAPLVESESVDPEQADESEQDKALRRPGSLPVRFGTTGLTEEGVTADLSEEGLFIVTDRVAEVGTMLKFQLEVDAAKIPLKGIVRWKRDRPEAGRPRGMGIRLLRAPALYLHYVHRLP
jgi:hypothetical protein